MNSENKPVLLVDKSEEDQVSRNMVIWANTFPYLPDDLSGTFWEGTKRNISSKLSTGSNRENPLTND